MNTMAGPVFFTDRIHTSDGHSFSVEELYQAFKQRALWEPSPASLATPVEESAKGANKP